MIKKNKNYEANIEDFFGKIGDLNDEIKKHKNRHQN